MNLPFTLPDWVPWWVPIVLLVPSLLYALAFLFMPFSVLGVKTRLESIELRVEDLRQELRQLSLRLPAGREELDFEDVYAPFPASQRREPEISQRPPIPPPVDDQMDDDAPFERPPPPPNMRPYRRQEPQIVRQSRTEPRFGPPR